MTETILNVLVAAVAVNTIVSARFTVAETKLKAAEFGSAYVWTRVVTSVTVLGIWVWLAVDTGYWQFAAIIAIPLLIAVGALAARPRVS